MSWGEIKARRKYELKKGQTIGGLLGGKEMMELIRNKKTNTN